MPSLAAAPSILLVVALAPMLLLLIGVYRRRFGGCGASSGFALVETADDMTDEPPMEPPPTRSRTRGSEVALAEPEERELATEYL
mgnify:CR=1